MAADEIGGTGASPFTIKLLGDPNVGKRSLIIRCCKKEFPEDLSVAINGQLTLELHYPIPPSHYPTEWPSPPSGAPLLGLPTIAFRVGDLQEDSQRSMTITSLRSYHAFIMCYDVTDFETFSSLANWIRLLTNSLRNQTRPPVFIFAGLKADLADKMVVTTKHFVQLESEFKVKHFLVSSKTGQGCLESINHVCALLMEHWKVCFIPFLSLHSLIHLFFDPFSHFILLVFLKKKVEISAYLKTVPMPSSLKKMKRAGVRESFRKIRHGSKTTYVAPEPNTSAGSMGSFSYPASEDVDRISVRLKAILEAPVPIGTPVKVDRSSVALPSLNESPSTSDLTARAFLQNLQQEHPSYQLFLDDDDHSDGDREPSYPAPPPHPAISLTTPEPAPAPVVDAHAPSPREFQV